MENPRTHTGDSNSQMFLTGAILCANLEYNGLAEYALKALVGGMIWMGFKLAADYIGNKIRKK